VEYVQGRKATLYIYDEDGKEVEQVTLSEYKTKEEMHALMQDKGFVKKSEEEIEAQRRFLQQQKEKQNQREKAQRAKTNAERAQDSAGQGVDFVDIQQTEPDVDLKAQVWKAEQEAAVKARKEGKDWKKEAAKAGQEVFKKNEEARRRLMEL
jgi:hypothetical protein